ncbi:MAG: phosphoribosylanthranilate isomerase, partial [Planctomycetota bacterium]
MTLGSLERLPFKVCGVTNPEDARLCTAAGASAVGVILFAGSSRAVGLARARAVARAVQSSEAAIVGVFVNEEPAVVATLAEQVPLDVVQLSGHETL